MLTSNDLLDLAAARCGAVYGTRSTYRLADVLDCQTAHVYRWQRDAIMSPQYAVKIAYFIGIDPRYAAACVEFQRAKDPETRAVMRSIAEHFSPSDDQLAAARRGAGPIADDLVQRVQVERAATRAVA